MKRTPLSRKAPIKRGTVPLAKVNAKRRARLFADGFHSKRRVEWVRSLPSVVSGRGPCVNAHVVSRGAGGTYRDIVPLTNAEHIELHAIGTASFEAKHNNVSLTEAARRTEAAWREHLGGSHG